MHVLIQTAGSSGDVDPFVGLGRALVARGHSVDLLANEAFEGLVRAAGLGFVQLGTREQYGQLLADPALWHPQKGSQFVFERAVIPFLESGVDGIRALVRPAETVLVTSSLGLSARLVSEADGVPLVTAHLAPSLFRSLHHMPQFGGIVIPDGVPKFLKRVFWWIADRVVDPSVCPGLNAVRLKLGLPPVSRPFQGWIHKGDGLLGLFPEWFAARQPDWPAHLVCAGFPLFDEGEVEPLDADLDAWLSAGDPPLLFTHGSANLHARAFFHASAQAAADLGRRALLVSVEPRAIPDPLPTGVRHELRVPFSRVFRRCAAVVHHGGIGTTAQGLAAGVPQLVVPMAFDQYDNGSRVRDLGVGDMLAAKGYTAKRAGAMLRRLLDDPDVPGRARACADRMQAEDARSVACAEIERVAAAARGES
jgi:UDP:flavonoid glycosyltransferase YjiC (YdhE family)